MSSEGFTITVILFWVLNSVHHIDIVDELIVRFVGCLILSRLNIYTYLSFSILEHFCVGLAIIVDSLLDHIVLDPLFIKTNDPIIIQIECLDFTRSGCTQSVLASVIPDELFFLSLK